MAGHEGIRVADLDERTCHPEAVLARIHSLGVNQATVVFLQHNVPTEIC